MTEWIDELNVIRQDLKSTILSNGAQKAVTQIVGLAAIDIILYLGSRIKAYSEDIYPSPESLNDVFEIEVPENTEIWMQAVGGDLYFTVDGTEPSSRNGFFLSRGYGIQQFSVPRCTIKCIKAARRPRLEYHIFKMENVD